MGRVARGVRGITLKNEDVIKGLEILEDDSTALLLTVSENGYGKRTAIEQYRIQGRGGSGVINMVVDERNGEVVGSVQVHDTDRVMLITNTGRVIKIGVGGIRETKSRAAKGVTLMRVEEGEKIVAVTRVVDSDEEGSGEGDTPAEGALTGEE
jgi:DNA gyrase subunit A